MINLILLHLLTILLHHLLHCNCEFFIELSKFNTLYLVNKIYFNSLNLSTFFSKVFNWNHSNCIKFKFINLFLCSFYCFFILFLFNLLVLVILIFWACMCLGCLFMFTWLVIYIFVWCCVWFVVAACEWLECVRAWIMWVCWFWYLLTIYDRSKRFKKIYFYLFIQYKTQMKI